MLAEATLVRSEVAATGCYINTLGLKRVYPFLPFQSKTPGCMCLLPAKIVAAQTLTHAALDADTLSLCSYTLALCSAHLYL